MCFCLDPLKKVTVHGALKLEIRASFKPDLRFADVVFCLRGCPGMPFFPNSALCSKNYPRNINYMPAEIFFASLDFEKNCCSRTASWSPFSSVETRMVCVPALERGNGKRSNS